MTIKISIECDGLDCFNSMDIDECDTPEVSIRFSKWEQDPSEDSFHYCPNCWPKVKREIDKRDSD